MKKRTSLVCFLIFTLCVFYTAIPNPVFGQAEDASLAEQVHEKYSELLQREDIAAVLPAALEGLKAPNIQALLSPAAINAVVANPAALAAFGVNLDPEFITLLEEDQDVKDMLLDPLVQELLQDPAAIDELAMSLTAPPMDDEEETPPMDDGTTPPDDGTTPMPVASIAEQVLAKYSELLQREDLAAVLPQVLEGLKSDQVQGVLGTNPALINLVVADPSILATFGVNLDPEFVTLLEEDQAVKDMLSDPLVQSLLADVDQIDELAALLAAEPTEPTEPEPTEPEPTEPEPTEPEPTEPEPTEPTEPTEPVEPTEPPPPIDQAVPFEPIMPTDESLLGKSRLGGLSMNRISGRKFLADFAEAATGLSVQQLATLSGRTQDELVEMIVQLIPKEVPFTKKQIRAFLKSNDFPIFSGQIDGSLAQGLDSENFGNAITPMPIELFYADKTDPNRKYLTRDSLNLYVRVPSVNVGGVTFGSSDGTLQKEGRRVSDPSILGSETIPYTFRLEEALAATNLPAWPALENNIEQLFSDVTLRYSNSGLHGDYSGHPMTADFTENGVVWEVDVDVTQGNNFYYFEVVLATPVTLEVLDREQLAELFKAAVEGNLPSISDVLNATLDPPLEIRMWSMPDPRNLQLADRGILDALFDDDFRTALTNAAGPLLQKALSGESITSQEIFNALQKHQLRLQNILLRNSNRVTTQFESAFDPMLSSVFSIPKVDLESQSIWVASFDDIQDGNYRVGAVVHDEDGNPLDQMWSDVTVDTKAPEADVEISAGNNTVVYKNDDDVYVATNLEPGTATLKVTGIPGAGHSNFVGEGYGYLLYQILGLNPDGTPHLGDSSLQSPNTWMPLTPEATMLASTVWEQTIAQLVGQGALPEEIDLSAAGLGVLPTENLTLDLVNSVLPLLGTPIGLGYIENDPTLGPALKQLGDLLGQDLLDPKVINLIVEIFGATVDLINHIPITYGPNNDVMMLAQLGEDVLAGDYGIRALGIDTLFNVSSHTPPTRLRIVNSNDPAEMNKASVVLASIGDRNGDGVVDERYEHGTIYANTTEGVELTIKIDEHPHFLAGIVLEFQGADGNWLPIPDVGLSAAELEGTQTGAEFTVTFDVPDAVFNALVGSGNVMVRAVATNQLEITDTAPMEFSIKLDAGIYPPEVLDITVDAASITMRNPDSDGPQGTVTINAMTLPLTGPRTVGVRFEATLGDGAPINLGTATQNDTPGLVDAVDAAVDAAVDGADAPIDSGETVWSLDVDTTTLEDTITKDSPAARDVLLDNNKYTIRAFAVSEDGTEWPSDAMEMLSVDNVDDVGPLGPTNITAIADTDGMVEADSQGVYTLRGLIDPHDSSVDPHIITLTIKPEAKRKTYSSVMLVSEPEIDAGLITVGDDSENEGVFEITIDVGALGIEGNGAYMLHALVDDEFNNGQDGESPKHTVQLNNYLRPDPAVFKLMVDVGEDTNIDSGGSKGTFTFTGYTTEQNSPPIESIRLEAKRASDTDWATIGTGDASTSVDIEDAALPGVLDHLTGIAVEGTEAGNRSVVAIDATNKQWVVSVDTTELEDTITADSPGARDASKDDNQYTARAVAIDVNGKEWTSDATAMFSVDNVDDVAPLESTSVSVTSVDGVDVVFETAEDGSFTVGGLVDKYDDAVASPVATFTIEPEAKRETYKSVKLTMYPEGALVGEITETAEGSGVFTVTVDVGTLADGMTYLEEGTYTFQALAYDGVMDVVDDEFGNVETPTDESKASVTVDNSYRPAPEVLVIAVDPESITQTNPDSGAPQGTITLNSRSHEITSPPISGMRYEVKRPTDEEWIDVGTATESMPVSDVSDAELADFVGDVAALTANETEASGEATVVPIDRSQAYQEWMLEVDTTTLEDTITADSPAARDASKDDNQYMVRVTAIAEADGSETMSADGITAHFSVDNVDDVSPVGPTNIVAVADVAGMIAANEDGSYTVGGIVDDTVPSPIAIFTTEPTADPITYASVNLVQTTEDGTETVTMGEAGSLDVMIDVGLLENGTYMFHALAVDEFGNVQSNEPPHESPKITVHVLNFRVSDVSDLAVIAVDGTDVPEPPAEPIPLRESVTVSFMVANGSLAAEELSGAVNGQSMPSESAEDPENTFSLMVELGALPNEVYTPNAVVTQRNGSVAFPLTTVNVDRVGPMVTIESPIGNEAVDSLPTIRATYLDVTEDGVEGIGVDGATGTLTLMRLQPPNEVEIVVDQAELEKDAVSLVYTRTERLAGGAYRVTIEVADLLGNVDSNSQEFVVNGTLPTVAIHSPASGQTFDHGQPLISGEFSGAGSVDIKTLMVNGLIVEPEVEGNRFSYTPEPALANGNHTVAVEVEDGDGNTAQASVTFTVEIPRDTTPPVISSVAPTGVIKDSDPGRLGAVVVSAVVTDEQSTVTSVKYSVNGGQIQSIPSGHIAEGKIEASVDYEVHGDGLYTVRLIATSEGGTTEHTWTFTLIVDNVAPTITSITPSGTIRGGLPVISASANDESGVAEMSIVVMDSDGEEVGGETQDDGEDGVSGITRLDFNPEEPLEEGVYTVEVRATDPYSNSATAKGTFTVDFDTAAPVITVSSPRQDTQILLKAGDKAPTVSITYADAESGVNVDSIRFILNDQLLTLSDKQKSASQVIYQLPISAASIADIHDYSWVGEYSVQLEVSDNAHLESDGRKANTTVHTFSFSIGKAEVPLLSVPPINVPNPFVDSTEIRFTLNRQSRVNIVIYDSTLRPVRVLIDGVAEQPGKKEIEWDGTSSGGEDLARGIYFCQIIVTDNIEPEYAILKLALTR